MTKYNQIEYELIPVEEGSSFAVREFRLPQFTSPWHRHPEIELTLIISGNGTRFVGDHAAAFRPGDLVLVGANTPHYWRSADGRAGESHSVVIQFREDCLGPDFFQRPEMRGVLRLLTRARRGLAFSGAVRNRVADEMRSLPTRRGPGRVAALVTILAMLADVRRVKTLSGESFLCAADFPGNDHIHWACRYVFEHLSESICLADVARAVALAPETVSRSFRRVTGKTLFDFVNDARIGHACVQLMETDKSIAEIAFASGFNTLANFNRRFRERKNTTPRQFRAGFRKDRMLC